MRHRVEPLLPRSSPRHCSRESPWRIILFASIISGVRTYVNNYFTVSMTIVQILTLLQKLCAQECPIIPRPSAPRSRVPWLLYVFERYTGRQIGAEDSPHRRFRMFSRKKRLLVQAEAAATCPPLIERGPAGAWRETGTRGSETLGARPMRNSRRTSPRMRGTIVQTHKRTNL